MAKVIESNGTLTLQLSFFEKIFGLHKNINDNVDNVTATGFNVVTAATIGNGVTGGDGVGGECGRSGAGVQPRRPHQRHRGRKHAQHHRGAHGIGHRQRGRHRLQL